MEQYDMVMFLQYDVWRKEIGLYWKLKQVFTD